MMNNITDDPKFFAILKRKAFFNGGIFVVFFLWFLGLLLTSWGYTAVPDGYGGQVVEITPYKYFYNFISIWQAGVMLIIGVVLVLYGWGRSCFSDKYTQGIWFTGSGTFFAVMALFSVAGFNFTPFYPSLLDPESSLTIRNASSSEFTLTVMSYVSIVIPFVLAYIAYVWYSMDRKKLTPEEMKTSSHKY